MSQKVEKVILKTVSESRRRITPGDLQKKITHNYGLHKKQIQRVLNTLVEQGVLVYSYRFGCSFVEISFNRAVRISKRVVLKPPNVTFQAMSDDIIVEIQKGASFGTGAHPTTRLAVKAIEGALSCAGNFILNKKLRALDIGTGTGVLCITAVRLGIDSAIGLDIDPCAISEARKNILLNNLQQQIIVSDSLIEELKETFFLIIANLRYPTLKLLCSEMNLHMEDRGLIVLSGIKAFEVEDLLKTYTRNYFDLFLKFEEKGWSSLVLKKKYTTPTF